jgi:hypothetical protein
MTQLNDVTPSAKATSKHQGGCHCGAVRFELELEGAVQGSRCNCSICTKVAQTGAIVKPSAFRLLEGEESLSKYVWGRISTRHFCKHCGVHCFGLGHLAEVGGDFASVNLNCVDDVDVNQIPVIHWDGRHDNWQAGPKSAPWPRFRPDEAAAAE